MVHNAEVQHAVADMVMALESVEPQISKLAEDWSNGVDYGIDWVIKIVAAKYTAVEAAFKVADTAVDLAGGFGTFKGSVFERLFRDARMGRIHPANPTLTREFIAKVKLGLNPDDQPRWG